jgi:hypothetical protein
MMRARDAFAAILVGVLGVGGLSISAQTQSAPPSAQPPAPDLKPVLAGKKFSPPIKGEANIDFVKTPTKREGSTLVTKIQVKNMSNAPIPRLTVDETWYDKSNNLIPGGKGVINGLLQPGEVQTIEIRTPANPNMSTSMLQFSHANGTVKTHPVKSLDAPKDSAPKSTTAAKK